MCEGQDNSLLTGTLALRINDNHQEARHHLGVGDRLEGQDKRIVGTSPGLTCLNRNSGQKGRHNYSTMETCTPEQSPDIGTHRTLCHHTNRCYNPGFSRTGYLDRGGCHWIGADGRQHHRSSVCNCDTITGLHTPGHRAGQTDHYSMV